MKNTFRVERMLGLLSGLLVLGTLGSNASIILYEDTFNDGAIGTNPDTGGGITLLNNASGMPGTVSESGSQAHIIHGTGNNATGFRSLSAFDSFYRRTTYITTWDVASWSPSDSNNARSLRFALQSNSDFLFNAGDGEESRVWFQLDTANNDAELIYQNRSGGGNNNHFSSSFDLGAGFEGDTDGFTVSFLINDSGYNVTTTGLDATSQVALAGTWAGLDSGGTTYAEVFQTDGPMYVAAYIQDNGGANRTLDIDSIMLTSMAAPEPSTLPLLGMGGILLWFARKRKDLGLTRK